MFHNAKPVSGSCHQEDYCLRLENSLRFYPCVPELENYCIKFVVIVPAPGGWRYLAAATLVGDGTLEHYGTRLRTRGSGLQ